MPNSSLLSTKNLCIYRLKQEGSTYSQTCTERKSLFVTQPHYTYSEYIKIGSLGKGKAATVSLQQNVLILTDENMKKK